MARLLLIALVARLIVCATATMSFINPPSHSNTNGDFSNAITYKQGQVVNVVSTPADPGHDSSVVLYQLNNKTGQYFGAWEYVTHSTVNVTSYQWIVETGKNLSVSNLFFLSIFQSGNAGGSADDNSEYFYIDKNEAAQPATSSTATTLPASALPSHTSSSLSANPSSTTGASGSFPLAAKIGMGIGILVALALGLGIGYLVFRRRKKNNEAKAVDAANFASFASPQEIKYQHDGSHYGSHMYEAPSKTPVELPLSQADDIARQHHEAPSQPVPIRYEM